MLITQVEHKAFLSLVMSATEEQGYESSKFYSRLLELISEKRKTKYCVSMTWIRRKILFASLKSIGMCIRGGGSVFHRDKLEKTVKQNEFHSELSSKI